MPSSNKHFFDKRAIIFSHAPSHYLNKWQDKYAFDIRTKALKDNILFSMQSVLDAGCGDGQMAEFLISMKVKEVICMDQSIYMLGLCWQRLSAYERFRRGVLSQSIDVYDPQLSQKFDSVLMSTTYQFMDPEIRDNGISNLYDYLNRHGVLVVLDYFPFEVPEYQKHLHYKWVDTYQSSVRQIESCGFRLRFCWNVSFVDSKLFHFLGKNWVSYALTKFLDTHLTKWVPSRFCKYRLLLFSK